MLEVILAQPNDWKTAFMTSQQPDDTVCFVFHIFSTDLVVKDSTLVHTRQGFLRFSPVLDISIFYEGV